jgi:hypothetical protein
MELYSIVLVSLVKIMIPASMQVGIEPQGLIIPSQLMLTAMVAA